MAIQVVAQIAAKVGQAAAQTTARVGATAGRLTARGAQKGAQAAARAGAKAGQSAARGGAKGAQNAAKAGRNVRTHGPKARDPRRPGNGPKLRDHKKGSYDPKRPGGRAKLRDHNGPMRNPRRPGEKAQSQGAEPPKQPLKSDAKGLGKLKPQLKARAQRQLMWRGGKKLRSLAKGDDRQKDKSKGDGFENTMVRRGAQAIRAGAKFLRKRIRRIFIKAELDKVLQKTKKIRRRFMLLAGICFMFVLFMPIILGIIVAVMLSNDEAGLAAVVVANQPVAATSGGIPPGKLDEVAAATGIPLVALTAYSKASANPDWSIDWTILAGIGFTECNHGQSAELYCTTKFNVWTTPGGAGERGPMQHLGDLWRAGIPGTETEQKNTPDVSGPPTPKGQEQGGTYVATDGNRDGIADPWDWDDAVLSAARKLTLYRKQLKAMGPAYDTDEFMIAAYNAGVGGATENGSNPKNIKNRSYITKVEGESKRIKTAVQPLNLPSYNMANVACPTYTGKVGNSGLETYGPVVIGSTEPITDAKSTKTNMAVANAAIACFGRGAGVGCQSERPGDLYEHPRGRACDYMRSKGGSMPDAVEKSNGEALANWAVANAKDLNILYVIWYGKIWSVSRDGKPKPWAQWRDYGQSGVTAGHYDHVHISVKLMPGDPPRAHCTHSSCTE